MWLKWVVMKSTFIYQQSLNENDKRAPLHLKVVKKNITLCFSKYIYLEGLPGSEGDSSYTGSEYSLAENSMKSEPWEFFFSFSPLAKKITKHLVSLH